MASDWNETTLGNEVDLLTGFPFKSEGYTDSDDSIRLVRGDNIVQGAMRWDGVKKWPRSQSAEHELYQLRAGDVVLAMDRPWIEAGLKYSAISKYDVPCLLVQRTARLRGGPRLDTGFLRYLIGSREFTQHIHAITTGTAVPHISARQIKDFEFTLPPLSEQKAIAAMLGALDDKIELNRRMNTTLEAMARTLFQSWFVDFDPVRRNADCGTRIGELPPADPNPKSAIENPQSFDSLFPAQFQDSELGEIPQGWAIAALPEVIDFLEGPGLRKWQYRDEGMKFLNIRCIGNGDLDIAKANSISVEEFEKTYSHFALQVDDIVISTSGTLGRLAIVRNDHLPVMLNTSIIRMRGRGDVGLGYVWGFLQSEYFLSEMFAMAAGSVQLNFGPIHLRKISLLRPPDEVLTAFESAVQPLLRKCLHVRKESRTLAILRDTLLPKLLSGELSAHMH